MAEPARLTEALRETDTLARLGGDELVFLLADISHTLKISGVATKMFAAIAQPIAVEPSSQQETPRVVIVYVYALFRVGGEDVISPAAGELGLAA